jgi:hypothetical protein
LQNINNEFIFISISNPFEVFLAMSMDIEY